MKRHTIDEAEATVRRREQADTHGLDLFSAPALARPTDPETSHTAAARNAKSTAAAQKNLILVTLSEHGHITADALDLINDWRVGTASRRLPEMSRADLPEAMRWVERLTMKAPTRTGELAHAWALTRAGAQLAKQLREQRRSA